MAGSEVKRLAGGRFEENEEGDVPLDNSDKKTEQKIWTKKCDIWD